MTAFRGFVLWLFLRQACRRVSTKLGMIFGAVGGEGLRCSSVATTKNGVSASWAVLPNGRSLSAMLVFQDRLPQTDLSVVQTGVKLQTHHSSSSTAVDGAATVDIIGTCTGNKSVRIVQVGSLMLYLYWCFIFWCCIFYVVPWCMYDTSGAISFV